MSDGQGQAAPRQRSRQTLDAMATAIGCALDAREVLIVEREQGSWLVRGGAYAAPTDDAPSVRLHGLEHAASGAVLEVTVWGDGDGLHVAPTDSPGSGGLAIVSGSDLDQPVMLVATGVDGRHRDGRLTPLLAAVVDAVRAEDRVHRQLLRDSLQEREDERRRWARELHDETLQQLGALQLLLTSARQHPDPAGEDGRERLPPVWDQAIDLLTDQIIGLRHLINELRPAALDELGLRPPLEALAERTEQLTGMRVDMRVSLPYADGLASTRLLPDVELAVYRVVQEALTNAARHSGGTQAWVRVVEDGDQVRVDVSDNGTGTSRLTGFGIDGMRERATLAGGRLDVIARPIGEGGGTDVRMVVPAWHRPPAGSERGQPGESPQG